jgi:hypothetical protein
VFLPCGRESRLMYYCNSRMLRWEKSTGQKITKSAGGSKREKEHKKGLIALHYGHLVEGTRGLLGMLRMRRGIHLTRQFLLTEGFNPCAWISQVIPSSCASTIAFISPSFQFKGGIEKKPLAS